VIGICDTPAELFESAAHALDLDPARCFFDYFGLNHLGWLRGVHDGERELLADLLLDDAALAGLEEGRLFGADWLRTLGMIPNEYLYYFYFAADTIDALGRGGARGEFLLRQQAEFYAGDGGAPDAALAAWRATRRERERTYMAEAGAGRDDEEEDAGGYEGEAMAVVDAIHNDSRAVLILDVANRSALPGLDEQAVVEVPCVVGATGPHPVAAGEPPAHAAALLATVKAVERLTIEAARSGSAARAVEALALHPLVPSVTTAREIFAGYRARIPELAERFR
jgi:6-phospho-beta-glucosidase